MRVTVIGASGGIGREVVRQGLDAGHEVTAVVRDSPRSEAAIREWERVPAGGVARVHVAVVESLSAAALAGAVGGQDAVVSALGPPGRSNDPTVNSRGVRAAVEAMRPAGVARIVAVSAAPLFAGGPLVYRTVLRPLLWAAFRAHYEDLVRMERELTGSGLDWTTVRPPKLTNRPGRGTPQLSWDAPPRGAAVARADVATAILGVLTDPATIGHALGVSAR
jgi:nucleoside-diphosphate-sugar epimerase